jgi:hypothetical protein
MLVLAMQFSRNSAGQARQSKSPGWPLRAPSDGSSFKAEEGNPPGSGNPTGRSIPWRADRRRSVHTVACVN